MMKIFYWGPYISKVATVKAITESARSLKKYSKEKIDLSLIDTSGEWQDFKDKKINIIHLNGEKHVKNRVLMNTIFVPI